MTGLERFALGALGVSFSVRALNVKLPWWARAGYGLAGAHMVISAATDTNANEVPAITDATLPAGAEMVSGLRGGRLGKVNIPRAPVKMKFEARKARSIEQRVAFIHEQMLKGVKDPNIYGLARSVLRRKCGDTWCTPEKDARAELTALFNEVRTRVRYTMDPAVFDAFQTPGKTLELGTGDCDDETALLGALCLSIGYPVQSRVVHTQGFDTYNHIYLRAKLPDGSWMTLDPTVAKPAGWEVPAAIMKSPPRDFNVKL